MNRLSLAQRAQILACLTEGNSLRATTRMIGCSINTVTKLLVDVGTACAIYQNDTLRNLTCKRLQLDEIWSFVGMKQKNVAPNRAGVLGYGDVYTWVALDADTKLVPSWLVGTRDAEYAHVFVSDLASRIKGRTQVTTDGHKAYLSAIEDGFGSEVDYSMLVKLYGNPEGNQQERRYSAGKCCGTITGTVCGEPDPAHVSTSYVERQNLTMRMSMKRFARLSNGFSKKLHNHECAVAMHYMFYNFGRIHKTLRVTPAMQAGISDHIWSLEEIAELAH